MLVILFTILKKKKAVRKTKQKAEADVQTVSTQLDDCQTIPRDGRRRALERQRLIERATLTPVNSNVNSAR